MAAPPSPGRHQGTPAQALRGLCIVGLPRIRARTELKLSRTPVSYATALPVPGADTGAVIVRDPGEFRAFKANGVIDGILDA